MTDEFTKDCELEAQDLLTADRIMELLVGDNEGFDFNLAPIMELQTIANLYATHRHDTFDLGRVIDRYFRGLAENKAYLNIKREYDDRGE